MAECCTQENCVKCNSKLRHEHCLIPYDSPTIICIDCGQIFPTKKSSADVPSKEWVRRIVREELNKIIKGIDL